MGQTLVTLTLHGPRGSAQVEALADTGATFTKLPRNIVERVGLRAGYEVPVQLGDGRTITRPLALAEVEIQNVRRPVLVAVADNNEQPLAGYTTLEALGFKVNPVTHALESTPAIEY
ncbi:MAG: retroviral-like aspartic protease family protein [Chloroflexi bacterium]|nr:retroviral-like aspartic protease family protein [Chloroflexota bacterium]